MAHEKIINFLQRGESNAITTGELATILGLNPRQITLEIASERAAGAVILSSGRGFFLPANRAEVEHFCRMMDARAKKIFLASRSAKQLIQNPAGQLKFD